MYLSIIATICNSLLQYLYTYGVYTIVSLVVLGGGILVEDMESYILNVDKNIQDHLLKYLECGMLRVKKYIDDGKSIDELYEDTKRIYWSVKESQIEVACTDLNITD